MILPLRHAIAIGLVSMGLLGISCKNRTMEMEKREKTPETAPGLKVTQVSTDPTYGYSQQNPILIGRIYGNLGRENEDIYFGRLAGPNGEELHYEMIGTCCEFETGDVLMGKGVLDEFKIWWEGSEEKKLYVNMYKEAEVFCPVGLTLKPR